MDSFISLFSDESHLYLNIDLNSGIIETEFGKYYRNALDEQSMSE